MQANSWELRTLSMVRVRRHRRVAGTIALLLAGLAPTGGFAQDVKLLAQCSSPQVTAPAQFPSGAEERALASPSASLSTVSCNLWATDAVTFKGVKASIKGRTDRLDVQFEPRNQTLAVMFMIQLMDPSRRSVMTPMLDAVVRIAEPRDSRHRYAAYTVANDLNPVADFGSSKSEFDKQVRAVRGAVLPTQLYKGALEAIAKLAKEKAERKALVILGDGNSDDQSYEHEQVVKAAKEAGVIVHALGFTAEVAEQPKFQNIRRLADDTGGFRREVRVGPAQRYTIGPQFVAEALENGGTATISLREPPGPVTVTMTADFAGGRSESAQYAMAVPATPAAPQPAAAQLEPAAPPATWHEKLVAWARENKTVALISGIALGLGTIGLALFGFSSFAARKDRLEAAALAEQPVYGWLDMLDGNASRYPLQTTNVRIGRHRDNDICLLNDSISRRHAVLHFDAEKRTFVITDLGGGNGVVVNKVKQQSHDLNDGDLVELGEVRLRFRANAEAMG
jgi:FHA domain-containing protein/von Willebrand factor type A domain-containing protein